MLGNSITEQFTNSLKWIIAKTDTKTLLKMLEKKIDIHSVYKLSELLINCIYDGKEDNFYLTNYNDVNKQIIPNKGTYLKPDNINEKLVKSIRERHIL